MGCGRLIAKIKKKYAGMPVPKKYQSEYGKRYDSREALEVAWKIKKARGL